MANTEYPRCLDLLEISTLPANTRLWIVQNSNSIFAICLNAADAEASLRQCVWGARITHGLSKGVGAPGWTPTGPNFTEHSATPKVASPAIGSWV
jgi:hypothetical protein